MWLVIALALPMSQHLFKTALGQALREARKRTPGKAGRSLSQGTIARHLDVDKGTVTAWENGNGGLLGDEAIEVYAKLCDTTYEAIIARAAELVRDETRRRGAGPSG